MDKVVEGEAEALRLAGRAMGRLVPRKGRDAGWRLIEQLGAVLNRAGFDAERAPDRSGPMAISLTKTSPTIVDVGLDGDVIALRHVRAGAKQVTAALVYNAASDEWEDPVLPTTAPTPGQPLPGRPALAILMATFSDVLHSS